MMDLLPIAPPAAGMCCNKGEAQALHSILPSQALPHAVQRAWATHAGLGA